MSDPAAVERMLRRIAGPAVSVTSFERIGGWHVARCAVEGTRDRTVVVKWGSRGQPWTGDQRIRAAVEYAAIDHASDLRPGWAPGVIATDLRAGILVMEDLAPRRSLLELISDGVDGASTAGVRAFAVAVAELSAASVGRRDDFARRLRALGAPTRHDDLAIGAWDPAWRDALGHADALGTPIAAAAARDLQDAEQALTEPGPFLAFSGGDTGVNNYLLRDDDIEGRDARFIDFEYGRHHHALADAACLYVPPPAWITVGEPVADGTEAAYRIALTRGIPEAEDERAFGDGITAASCAYAVARLRRFPVLESREPGHPSRVQLVSILEAAARTARTHHALPDLAGWLLALGELFRARWPDTDTDLEALGPYVRRV